jgi:hypothetical protein
MNPDCAAPRPHLDRLAALGISVTRFAEVTGFDHVTVRNWGKPRSGRRIQTVPVPVGLILDAWEKHPDLIPRQQPEAALP